MNNKGPLLLQYLQNQSNLLDQPGSAENQILSFHLLADCIERFDTLLLEIRHLQTNLIYAMRFEELNAALRFEESFVFGSCETKSTEKDVPSHCGWSEIFYDRSLDLSPSRLPRLATAFVPVLPVADDDKRFQMESGDLIVDVSDHSFPEFHEKLSVTHAWRHAIAPITRTLRRRILSGLNDDNFEMHYSVYVALQALKRNIVSDKLHVSWFGLRAFGLHDLKPDTKREERTRYHKIGDFLLARSAALSNMSRHLERLSDYHAQFEKTLDIGSQENHRPITGRRREQGLYHHMLGERAKDMFLEVSDLARFLLKIESDSDIFSNMPTLIHRWQHTFSSQNADLISIPRSSQFDPVSGRESTEQKVFSRLPSYTTFAVNTSFWMPDRPDLQPVIAHEAAHCVLVELFGDLETPLERYGYDNPLVDFWRALMTVDNQWRSKVLDIKQQHAEMREILTDVLAATISGPEYLFALFQELTGAKLGSLFTRGDWRHWRDLSKIEYLLKEGIGYQKIDLSMYPRIIVVADALKAILRKEENTALTETLISGIVETANCLLDRLETLKSETDPTFVEAWKSYANNLARSVRLCGILPELSVYRKKAFSVKETSQGRSTTSHINPNEKPVRDNERLNGSSSPVENLFKNDDFDEPLRHAKLTGQVRTRLTEYFIERKIILKNRICHNFFLDSKFRSEVGNKIRSRLPQQTGTQQISDASDLEQKLYGDPEFAKYAIEMFSHLFLNGESMPKKHIAYETPDGQISSRDEINTRLKALGLFERLGDVPWQAALLRSMEINVALNSSTWPEQDFCLLHTLSADYLPGKETTQLAIEFWSSQRQQSTTTLAETNRLVMDLLRVNGDNGSNGPLTNVVNKLVRANDKNTVAEFLQSITNFSKAEIDDWNDGELKSETEAALRAFLEKWLGTAIDADFTENTTKYELSQKLGAHSITTPVSDKKNKILNIINHYSDNLTQMIRVFEVIKLSKIADIVGKRREFALSEIPENLGALQIIKLDHQYPKIVFPLKIEKKIILDEFDSVDPSSDADEILKDFEQRLKTDRPNFIKRLAEREAKDCSEFNLFGQPGPADAYFGTQIRKIFELDKETYRTGMLLLTGHDHLTFDQRTAMLKSRRSTNSRLIARRIAAIASSKIEALSEIIEHEILNIPDLAPLRSLIRLHLDRIYPRKDEVLGFNKKIQVSSLFKGLSRPGNGLRRFKTIYLSKQSLIDTHWWREDPTGEARTSFAYQGAHSQADYTDEFSSPKVRQFATLGRYDYFNFSNDYALSQNRQTIVDRSLSEKNATLYGTNNPKPFSRIVGEHTYRTYFERKEHAVSLSLDGEPVDVTGDELSIPTAHGNKELLCVMSVRLDRRSSRLGFVHRLRKARADWNEYKHSVLDPDDNKTNPFDLTTTHSNNIQSINPFFSHTFRSELASQLLLSLKNAEQLKDDRIPKSLNRFSVLGGNFFAPTKLRKNGVPFLRSLGNAFNFIENGKLNNSIPWQPESDISQLNVAYEIVRQFGDLPTLPLEAAGKHLSEGDAALLGQGWGDVYLLLFCEKSPTKTKDESPASYYRRYSKWIEESNRRLFDIFALQHSIFQDFQVHRTEMFLRPEAIPIAAHDHTRFNITFSVRTKEDRNFDGSIQAMINASRSEIRSRIEAGELAAENVKITHIPGRNDLEFHINDIHNLKMDGKKLRTLNPTAALNAIHNLVGAGQIVAGGGSEEILTRVGFKHFL